MAAPSKRARADAPPEQRARALAGALLDCQSMSAADIDAALAELHAVQARLPRAEQEAVVMAVLACLKSKKVNWQRLYNVVRGIVGYPGPGLYGPEDDAFIRKMVMSYEWEYDIISFLHYAFRGELERMKRPPQPNGSRMPLAPSTEDLYDAESEVVDSSFNTPYMMNNPVASFLLDDLDAGDQEQVDYHTSIYIMNHGQVPLPMLLANSPKGMFKNLKRIIKYDIPEDQIPYILKVVSGSLTLSPEHCQELLRLQLAGDKRSVDVPLLSAYAKVFLSPDGFLDTLLLALQIGNEDVVAWLLREQRDASVYQDEGFTRILRRYPSLKQLARQYLGAEAWAPKAAARMRGIQRRKYRERITRSKLVYRWEDICSGRTPASDEELQGYALDLAMMVDDLQERGTPRPDMAARLQGEYAASGLPLKRAVCLRIADLIDEYKAIVAGMDCPLLSEERVEDIPLGQLITWVENNGRNRYCFSTDEMAQMEQNPYTNQSFPVEVVERARRYKDAHAGWVYDRNEAARDAFMADTRTYSALWEMLNTGYPVSQTAYRALPREAVLDLDQQLRNSAEGAFSRADALLGRMGDSDDVHLALARKLVAFLHGTDDDDFHGKVLLVNEALSDATADQMEE